MDLFSPQVPPSDFHPNFRALPYVRNQKLSEKEVLCSVQAAELKFQRLINLALLLSYASTGLQQDVQVMFFFMSGAEMLMGAGLATGGVLTHLGHRNGVQVMRVICWAGTALQLINAILVYKPDTFHPAAGAFGAFWGAVVGAFIRYGIVLILIRR